MGTCERNPCFGSVTKALHQCHPWWKSVWLVEGWTRQGDNDQAKAAFARCKNSVGQYLSDVGVSLRILPSKFAFISDITLPDLSIQPLDNYLNMPTAQALQKYRLSTADWDQVMNIIGVLQVLYQYQ